MTVERPRISAALITQDAERTLERTLDSLAWVDEIVVVDSGSTDATERIARERGARFLRREWPGYGVQKRRAVAEAEGEWILSVDADEVVSDELARSIRRAMADPEGRVAFKMACHTRFMGVWLGGRGWWTDWKLRLFRRDAGRFNDAPIHEGVSVEGEVGFLDGPLYHYPWRDLAHRIEKENRYSTLAAERDFARGRRSGAVRPFFWGLGWFLKDFVIRGGFLHGAAGLYHSGLSGAYAYHREVKLFELTRYGSPKESEFGDEEGAGVGDGTRVGADEAGARSAMDPPGPARVRD